MDENGGGPSRILVVEDNHQVRRVVVAALGRSKFAAIRVDAPEGWQQFIRLLNQAKDEGYTYNILFLDWTLWAGYTMEDALAVLQKRNVLRRPLHVVCISDIETARDSIAEQLGVVVVHLKKPFGLAEVPAALSRAMLGSEDDQV